MGAAMVVLVFPAAQLRGELAGCPERRAAIEFLAVGAVAAFDLAIDLGAARGGYARWAIPRSRRCQVKSVPNSLRERRKEADIEFLGKDLIHSSPMMHKGRRK